MYKFHKRNGVRNIRNKSQITQSIPFHSIPEMHKIIMMNHFNRTVSIQKGSET